MIGAPPKFLLDTNILVHYARKSICGLALEAKLQFLASPFKPFVCVVTLGEIQAFSRNWGEQKQAALLKLTNNLVVIDIHAPDVLSAFAEIRSFTKDNGIAMGDNDVWIAAATKVTGSRLITCDKDFDRLQPAMLERFFADPMTGAIQS